MHIGFVLSKIVSYTVYTTMCIMSEFKILGQSILTLNSCQFPPFFHIFKNINAIGRLFDYS